MTKVLISTNATNKPINIYSETFSLCNRTFLSRSLVPIDDDIVPVWLFRGLENLVRVRCSGGATVVFSSLFKVPFCSIENMVFRWLWINIPFSFFPCFPCIKRYEKCCNCQVLVKRGWQLGSESLQKSFLNSHVLVKREQELHESWWKLISESLSTRVFLTLMFWSNENKSWMRVNESWQTRVCIRVFSTFMVWLKKNESFMGVNESWQTKICARVFSTFMSLSNEDESREAKVCMMKVFSSTFMPWSNKDGSEFIRVEKREFVWEFSHFSCPGQTRMDESLWELRSESLFESFLISHVLVKQGWMRVYKSWKARVCIRVFSTLMSWSNKDKSWWELRSESLDESFSSLLQCPGEMRTRVGRNWRWICLRLFILKSWPEFHTLSSYYIRFIIDNQFNFHATLMAGQTS